MDFRILGPLEVSHEGQPLRLGGPQQRLVLALLLLHSNEVVSDDLLVDAVWGEQPPASATNVLHVYVSKLRKLLAVDNGSVRVLTRPPGYVLSVEPEELDAASFEQLLEEGKRHFADGDAEAAATRLRAALALWRGPALADFAFHDFAQGEITRLDELRMEALEDLVDADLACGRHAHVVGGLVALVAEHPLRERLRRQQMLALYRSGRQAEALRAYQDARRTFVDELGIEPTPALKELHQRLLNQDPALETDGVVRTQAAQDVPARKSRRRRLALSAVALIAAALAAAVGLALFSGHEKTNAAVQIGPIESGLAVALDPGTKRVLGRLHVTSPTSIAVGGGAVWVTSYYGRTVSRIDAATHELVDTIGLSGRPTDSVYADGDLWVLSGPERTLWRVDPRTDTVTQAIPMTILGPPWIKQRARGPAGVAAGAGAIWVSQGPTTVSRVDPATGRVVARVQFLNPPHQLAAGNDAVWVGHADGTVSRIDPSTNSVDATVQAGGAERYWIGGLAVSADGVWIASPNSDRVWRIDPFTRRATAAIKVGKYPLAVAAGTGVWVGSRDSGTVSRIDPATNRVVQTLTVGRMPVDLATANGALWVLLDNPAASEHLSFWY